MRSTAPAVRGARASEAMERAADNLARLQDPDGSWPGDYGGPMFLLPLYLALCHAAGRLPPARRRESMIRYLSGVQHEDGSIGLHAEDPRGSMFCTVLGYVALRILGLPPEDLRLARARAWMSARGGPLGAASWGKVTLCLLGLYDWRGIVPVLPELWLLPPAAPFHPGRLWCHCRQVYLPMAWLFGRKAAIAPDPLIRALREELYAGSWERIDWPSHRETIAPGETYRAPPRALAAVNRLLAGVERLPIPALRRRALAEVLHHIDYEDEVTSFVDIGPVNKVLNAFVHFFRDPAGTRFARAFAACEQYLFDGHDGTKFQGYNSSRLWDTAFAVQAVLSSPASAAHGPLLEKAYGYLRDNQILDDVPEPGRHYRHRSRGGWPFSNRAHGWPITDCTSEGLKCALSLAGRFAPQIPQELLADSVRLILSWQNADGGWATYEKQRGGAWLELLNPSQVFGEIMVDYSHVECTSACLQALAAGRTLLADSASVEAAIRRGERFLRARQRADGSFEGAWGVCFTYGTWFGVSGLLASGVPRDDPAVLRACEFLLQKQRADGGWGEHGDSSRERRYLDAGRPLVAQTSWALSALARARHPSAEAQSRAARFLVECQERDGSWAREPMVGVFNRTCLINYDNYRHYFPLWALGDWSASA